MGQQEKISNDNEYTLVMVKIDSLMAKGSKNISAEELLKLSELAVVAQEYERQKYLI